MLNDGTQTIFRQKKLVFLLLGMVGREGDGEEEKLAHNLSFVIEKVSFWCRRCLISRERHFLSEQQFVYIASASFPSTFSSHKPFSLNSKSFS